jgi:GH25 family lysozyme M1 (1,4-beta-N-acetylmuramidase)
MNLANIPADIAFVSLKASQGVSYQDPFFQTGYHELKTSKPGVVRFIYHFFDWMADGEDQAHNVLSRGHAGTYQDAGTGPLMLDLEADSGSAAEKFIVANHSLCVQRVNDFIAAVLSSPLYGRKDLIIYSNDNFIKNVIRHTWPETIFWVASYQDNPPSIIPGWPYKFWQYSEFGQLDGTTTEGHLDLDQFMGTQEEFNALGNITNGLV